MVPTKELWAYSFLFAIAAGLFLDARMELITIIEIVASTFLAWVINGDNTLPDKDSAFFLMFVDELHVLFFLCRISI